MNTQSIEFTDDTIMRLFGTEAAEDEEYDRLKSYYVNNKTHRNLVSNTPIRILVGHKGIGKSAIFQIAQHEDKQQNRISIIIHPDDVSTYGRVGVDFAQMIRNWKDGLIEIIANKILSNLELDVDNEVLRRGISGTGKIVVFFKSLFERKINESFNLNLAHKATIEKFLKEKQIIVYIDDLDRGWESRKEDIQRISALLNAIRDLCNENKGLKIRISLRADVYYLVRTSDESTDKIESYVIWHRWENHDILLILIKRIETFFGRDFDVSKYGDRSSQPYLAKFLDTIFDERFEYRGKWKNAPTYLVLMSLIRKRPRDLVKLCTLAARKAFDDDSTIIRTEHLRSVFSEYSQGRIQDTINEYRSELPNIDRLLWGMKPSSKEIKEHKGWIYDTPGLKAKLRNIMSSNGDFYLKNGVKATETILMQLLYKINFITARKENEDGKIIRYYFEEKQYLSPDFKDFGYKWEIHPAFRWALSPDDDIQPLMEIDLSEN